MLKGATCYCFRATLGVTLLVAFFFTLSTAALARDKVIQTATTVRVDGEVFPAQVILTADIPFLGHKLSSVEVQLNSPSAGLYCEFTLNRTEQLAEEEPVILFDDRCQAFEMHVRHDWDSQTKIERLAVDEYGKFFQTLKVTRKKGSLLHLVLVDSDSEHHMASLTINVPGATKLPDGNDSRAEVN